MSGYEQRMMDAFPRMVDVLPECESENYRIEHFEITEGDLVLARMRMAAHPRRPGEGLIAGRFARLMRKDSSWNGLVMSDSFGERTSNYGVVSYASGDVLIGGLGFGMVVLAVQDKPEVKSVTVIEIDPEIIGLVTPHLSLNDKVTVVQADVFEWVPMKGTRYDTIYFDIWDDICADNYPEMARLHKRFGCRKRKGGWISSWHYEHTKYEAR